MGYTINARIPKRVEEKLAEYCTKQGVTRSRAVVEALDRYLDDEAGGVSAYSLAVDLIPPRPARGVRADRMREAARKAFGRTRPR